MAALLSLLVALPIAALAADAGQPAAWPERLGRAAAMQDESKAILAAAAERQAQKNLECATRFLINACRDEVSREYLQATRATRRLENDGKAREREVKREQLEDKRQRLADEVPGLQADLREREAETVAARQVAAQKAAATRAAKARQAVAGERRKVAEAERLRKKQAAHAARVAEKMRKAGPRVARGEAK